MSEEINSVPQDEEKKEKAGCLGIGASFFFPLIGIIIYFSCKNKVENPNAYLAAAGVGFAIGFILRAATM